MSDYELEALAVLELLGKVKKRTAYSVSAVPTMYGSGNAAVTVDTYASRAAVREWFRKAGAEVAWMTEPMPNHYRVVYRPVTIGVYVKPVAAKVA